MKVLGKIKSGDAHELSSNDMMKLGGGQSLVAYCCTLWSLIQSGAHENWSGGA